MYEKRELNIIVLGLPINCSLCGSDSICYSRAVATRFEVVRFDNTRSVLMRATCAQLRAPTRGVWGHAPPVFFWIFRPSEIVSAAIFRVKEQELLHACLALKTYTLAKL